MFICSHEGNQVSRRVQRKYSKEEIDLVSHHFNSGVTSPHRISKITGIPRPTIQSWVQTGKLTKYIKPQQEHVALPKGTICYQTK